MGRGGSKLKIAPVLLTSSDATCCSSTYCWIQSIVITESTSATDGPSVVQLLSASVLLSKDVALDVEVRLQSVRLIEVDNELVGELEDEELAGKIWLQLVRLDAE